jgi:hypothetical protein
MRPNMAATKRGLSAGLGKTPVTMLGVWRTGRPRERRSAAVRYTEVQVNGMRVAAFMGAVVQCKWSSEDMC